MHLGEVSQQLGLGELQIEPVLQEGGSLHQIWYVHTDQGEYTLKKINSNNMKLLGERLLPIEEYLTIGRSCNGINVRLHQLNNDTWLVKPWVIGATQSEISIQQAQNLFGKVSAIHDQPLDCSASKPRWGAVDLTKWRSVMAQHTASWVTLYQQNWSVIEELNRRAEQAADVFAGDWVVSHRDISNSNVIWNEHHEPVIIDWEFSGFINRQLDVYITAVNFDHQRGTIFETIMQANQSVQQYDEVTLFAGYCGYCFDWLDFNTDRLIHHPDQSEIAYFQLEVCMSQLLVMVYNRLHMAQVK